MTGWSSLARRSRARLLARSQGCSFSSDNPLRALAGDKTKVGSQHVDHQRRFAAWLDRDYQAALVGVQVPTPGNIGSDGRHKMTPAGSWLICKDEGNCESVIQFGDRGMRSPVSGVPTCRLTSTARRTTPAIKRRYLRIKALHRC